MGLLSFHRRHIQDFAKTAKCLSDLLQDDETEPTAKKGRKNTNTVPSSTSIKWEDNHRAALTKLIDAVTNPPILAYADFENQRESEFFVHTDASGLGLGAILYQEQKGMTRVIAYASRTLKPAEQRYHSSKLEFTAMRWAICDQFKDYLAYADHFSVFTDNNPLLYVLEQKKPNAATARWVNELSEYQFSIHFRAGRINRDADCLSRLPLDITEYRELCRETTTLDTFQTMVAHIAVGTDAEDEDDETTSEEEDYEEGSLSDTMKEDQIADEYIGPVLRIMSGKDKSRRKIPALSRLLLKHKAALYLNPQGLLCRKSGALRQVVLPLKHRELVYEMLHTRMGHLGAERTLQLARQRVYWPRMTADITAFTQERCRCLIQRRSRRQPVAPLVSIHTTAPMELVAIDFLHLEKATGGQEYILLVVDHFTRFAQGYPTRNKTARTAAKILFEDYITRFGIPSRILHDQGREFENKLFHFLEQHYGIDRARTTPYHPQTNGLVERMNSTLLNMMRTLPEHKKRRWPEEVNLLLFAYNSTKHTSTNHTPHFLMFGREPHLPLDIVLGRLPKAATKVTSYREYAENWEARMTSAYRTARESSTKSKKYAEKKWQERLTASELLPGDKVLIRNTEKGGPGKLRPQYRPEIYEVLEKTGEEGVVYKVSRLGGKKSGTKTLHRNRMIPCNQLDDLHGAPDQAAEEATCKRKRPTTRRVADRPVEESPSESDSDPETVLDSIEAPALNLIDRAQVAVDDGAPGSSALENLGMDSRDPDVNQHELGDTNDTLNDAEYSDAETSVEIEMGSPDETPVEIEMGSSNEMPETESVPMDDTSDIAYNDAETLAETSAECVSDIEQEDTSFTDEDIAEGVTAQEDNDSDQQGPADAAHQEPEGSGRRVLRSQGRTLTWNPSMGAEGVVVEKPPKRGLINWVKTRVWRGIKRP